MENFICFKRNNQERYINKKNIVLISYIKNKNKTKISFNFENIVSRNENKSYILPEFHYIFEDEYNVKEEWKRVEEEFENNKDFIKINNENGVKFINKNKINSFLIDKNNNCIYFNLNSTISNENKNVSLSVKSTFSETILKQLIQN